ncbi:5-methyltetrahydrofolate--homocysteine methyltransferase [Paraglaciecola sp.]|uniref:5-methyltetrahydrofolate--homocysteine methyltransferase n=1 Tax=Paraglaciecola sp. TaxID=1920173 RepID=UPI0030F41BA5
MTTTRQFSLLAATLSAVLLTGCGDAETTIIETDPIVVDGPDDGDGGLTIESMGRLAVLAAQSNEAAIFSLDDGDLLTHFSLIHNSNTLTVSADYRFAVIVSRSQDYMGFIDGGLWREDHVEHLHDYKQDPAMSDYELTGSRPTHIVKNAGQMAVFFDGDANTGIPASVSVLTDTNISNQTSELATLAYSINMHGVAEPRGEHLLASIRRDDAQSTSASKSLPDQVAVYHLHNTGYEQEQVLDVVCPDLHGAAQNHAYVVFGCSDGILLAHQHDDEYGSVKIVNIDGLDGSRIGTLYGHKESKSFIGIASGHGGGPATLISINPEENAMELLEWQPQNGANPVSYAFSHEGEHFLVLDNQGFLNILSPHEHNGETHWELTTSLNTTEQDISTMPTGMSFGMTVAQNGHYVYVSDPIAKHVLQIDLESLKITGDIELDFAPASITWLGIAEEGHDH